MSTPFGQFVSSNPCVQSITTPRFNFFEKEILKDPDGNGQTFDKFKELDVVCSAAGRGQLIICDREGTVFLLDKQLQITAFRAHNKSISHVHQLRQHNILTTVGKDEEGDFPIFKLWMMETFDGQGVPHCSRILRLSPFGAKDSLHNIPQEVSCMAVHESMQLLAFGFKSGAVILYKGDISKDKQSKFCSIYNPRDGENKGGSTEVTGLALRVVQKSQLLFLVTRNSLLAYEIFHKDKNSLILNENYGCAPRCSTLADDLLQNQFLVGRSDGVYYIQPEGRGGTAALEGEKYQVHWYRGYLVTVARSNINRDMDIVTIFDTLNKFIAYSGPIPHVINILFEWNAIYVLAGDNKLYMLLEKATQTKLEILFKKNQYITAINIAKSQHYDTHGLVDIFRVYGDYLYTERGDHDGAIEQYMKTIGRLEPSYVIRKFLDAQRLHNLTAYLEELHNKLHATEDHTTLLLNCYTKLKDEDKLDEFILKKDRNNEVTFDIETAIKVLRQADYHGHALQLAQKHSRHEWYLKIQLENIKDFGAALKYMQDLSFSEAENALKKYGKVLIQALPQETTSLLKRLCLGEYIATQRARPDEFIHIFVMNPTQLTEFLEAMISSEETPAVLVYNTLLELYIQGWAKLEAKSETKKRQEVKTMALLSDSNRYAKDQALVLCQMYHFDAGILFLYEQGRLYQQILRYHMEKNDYDQVISTCKKWGEIDSHLWVVSLAYFAEKEVDLRPQMKEVLKNIEQQKLLPPLLVIQTLANSRVCTLGVVKDFIMEQLLAENEQIERDEKLIKQYVDETQYLRQKIDDLATKPQVFQASRCSVCKYQLELPSIHFLCQHSYHTHCFESYAENESECPACAEDNRKILETIKEQERKRDTDLAKAFANELQMAKDSFNVVAEYFGRGVFQEPGIGDLSGDLSGPTLPDPSKDRYLTLPAAAKVSAGPSSRHNPFSNVGNRGATDTPHFTGPVDSDFPVYKDTKLAPSAGRTTYGSSQKPQISTSPEIKIKSTRPKQQTAASTIHAMDGFKGSITTQNDYSRMPAITVSGPKEIPKDLENRKARVSTATQLTTSEANAGPPFLSVGHTTKPTGHKRQTSAGKAINSGLSFIKGHIRQSSNQSSRSATSSPSQAGNSKASNNSFVEPPTTASTLPSATPAGQPAAFNPFEEPARPNPFVESAAANPFEEASGAHPTEESSNPFMDDLTAGSNPFEEKSKNPFE
ncbi:vacuolar protein sorting-associated protein 11 homolog isoform X2 [Watersipora subatra]|uniref:vacuolar protein sorting-associated protein 11 homolog isoform X2 n=1 Tax=Watersipora subatra TaxID=2589382 RepID=UPI00355AD96B